MNNCGTRRASAPANEKLVSLGAAENQAAARGEPDLDWSGSSPAAGRPPGKWDQTAEGARPEGLPGPSRDAEKHEGSELGAHLASVTNPKLQR